MVPFTFQRLFRTRNITRSSVMHFSSGKWFCFSFRNLTRLWACQFVQLWFWVIQVAAVLTSAKSSFDSILPVDKIKMCSSVELNWFSLCESVDEILNNVLSKGPWNTFTSFLVLSYRTEFLVSHGKVAQTHSLLPALGFNTPESSSACPIMIDFGTLLARYHIYACRIKQKLPLHAAWIQEIKF